MLHIATGAIVSRDQFVILPTPDIVIKKINEMAAAEGVIRNREAIDIDTGEVPASVQQQEARIGERPKMHGAGILIDDFDPEEEEERDLQSNTFIPIARRSTSTSTSIFEDEEVVNINAVGGVDTSAVHGRNVTDDMHARSLEGSQLRRSERSTMPIERFGNSRSFYVDQMKAADVAKTIFHMTVKAAMKGRPKEAEPAIVAELQQMLDKGVFHGVKLRSLSHHERKAILRSSMFLSDKYLASGAFEKFKARLVGGGNTQDHESYENLKSPTASTTSVFSIVAIAGSEGRKCATIDIGGAFLNADHRMGIKVHVRLDSLLAKILVKLDKTWTEFLEADGTMVVELDKALYGCIESAALWYNELTEKLTKLGFIPNPYDICVFNKTEADGSQTTIVLHVDDMFVSNIKAEHLRELNKQLQDLYGQTKYNEGKVLDYLGLRLDFTVPGEASVTMDRAIAEILREAGTDIKMRTTPATEQLFAVREDAPTCTENERMYFHSMTAKLLYVSKRVRPECLTAVSFLTTRVHACDQDDMAKLNRVLGYIHARCHFENWRGHGCKGLHRCSIWSSH
jgi:hypothetical protein